MLDKTNSPSLVTNLLTKPQQNGQATRTYSSVPSNSLCDAMPFPREEGTSSS